MKVALVHDYLNQYGGAERVLEVFCEIFPEAPIYTLLYNEKHTWGKFKNRKIITSFLNFLPGAQKHHRWFFPLMPLATEKWNFSGFDLVISLSASFAKGVITRPPTKHICYLLTPTRFLWNESEQRLQEELPASLRPFIKPLARLAIKKLRRWDFQAAQRPDVIIPISRHIKKSAERIYRRSVQKAIYPPVNIKSGVGCRKSGVGDKKYYIIVSRLIPYKRIDIAVQACEKLGAPLKIIGAGRDERRLRRLAKTQTTFLGELNDDLKYAYLANAEAFLMPQVEDFGIAAIEALSCGAPVLAFAAGGVRETVIEGQTGLFFHSQTSEALATAIQEAKKIRWDRRKIAASAEKFSKEIFVKKISKIFNEFFNTLNPNFKISPCGRSPEGRQMTNL
jgi:glycosyltransferase involved in cell wall biosynthesis